MRKAKLLAAQIKSKELENWINNESYGYSNVGELPDYRIFGAMNFGLFQGPYGTSANNVPLPIFDLPESIKKYAKSMAFFQGTKELEELVKTPNDEKLVKKWPAEAVILARPHLRMDGGLELADAWQPLSLSIVEGIIDTIKNKLLDFLIKLDETGVLNSKSNKEIQIKPEQIRNIYNITIKGNNAVVASGHNIHQNVEINIKKGDIKSLTKFLEENKFQGSDINELTNAIIKDGTVQKQRLGDQVKNWIGKMTSKAIEGSLKMGVQSVVTLINEGLKRYYGWD